MSNNNSNFDITGRQTQITDQSLLALIAKGDRDAFSQLMQRYLNPIILFAMRYFPQKSDAEDIAQETFIRLWCKSPDWQDRGISVKAWLYRVAYNQCIDQLRKQKFELRADCDENIVDESAFIDRMMGVEQDLIVQKIALGNLPERQRTAIMLCAVRGLSNIDAAIVMGISIDALESLLARGRRKLKKLYHESIDSYQSVETEVIQ